MLAYSTTKLFLTTRQKERNALSVQLEVTGLAYRAERAEDHERNTQKQAGHRRLSELAT